MQKTDDFGEFDGEAIAFVGDQVFVTGSHGCSREKLKFKPSAFVLARAKATGGAIAAKDAARTWRVSDAIQNSPLAGAFGRPGAAGAGIEGMAAIGNRLYLGFRTPSVQGQATILSVDTESLFVPGDGPSTAKPDTLTLELGTNTGIRDLAALDDRRLLVLSGPADASEGAYVLHLLTLSNRARCGRWRNCAPIRKERARMAARRPRKPRPSPLSPATTTR